jgi:heme-degrading monooxygenase HmoA
MARKPQCRFAVIYRWKLKVGSEPAFILAWAAATRATREKRGGLGSRLHQAEDGTWVAYAQWPTREDWERSRMTTPADPEATEKMKEAIEESLSPILLEPVEDLLSAIGKS